MRNAAPGETQAVSWQDEMEGRVDYAPIVGSLLAWKSFWQNLRTTLLLPTADSPGGFLSEGLARREEGGERCLPRRTSLTWTGRVDESETGAVTDMSVVVLLSRTV